MASVREASEGWSAAREMSQADVPISAIDAPMAPAPSAVARARRPVATRAMPSVRPREAGRSDVGSKTVPLTPLRAGAEG